ncbi:ABC transporter permease [Bosea robiniae]|uniref:NitT/TauT family transport system permease protein n=1 Tax=Bosea robiniae TaxID=1036780 RepID=A0ABY0P4E5_9HYPH|nr:ABC transporter permease [Bosea robiniae]SDH25173.1 NitT/TauT family transport system permease protein [Bosea robiniae]
MAKLTIGTETGAVLPASDTGRFRGSAGLSSVVLPLGLAFFVLAAWQLYVTIFQVPSVILPSPISIARYIVDRYDILLMHAVPTTLESAVGFLLAVLLGVAIAVLITYSDMAREALYPNLIFFQLIPKIALAPLFIIWLGVGSQSRIAFSIFIAFFPMVIATTAGFLSVDRGILRLCRSLTATEWQIFTSVRFPTALPHIFSGMKIAITLAIIGVIIGEFITAQAGLGYLIIFATARADTEVSMAAIVVLCICGLLLYGLVALAEMVANRFYSADSR